MTQVCTESSECEKKTKPKKARTKQSNSVQPDDDTCKPKNKKKNSAAKKKTTPTTPKISTTTTNKKKKTTTTSHTTTTTNARSSLLSSLPHFIVPIVFKFMDTKTVFETAALVCKSWHSAFKANISTLFVVGKQFQAKDIKRIMSKFNRFEVVKLANIVAAVDSTLSAELFAGKNEHGAYKTRTLVQLQLANLKQLRCPRFLQHTCSTLQHFTLSSCPKVELKFLQAVLDGCPQLQRFELARVTIKTTTTTTADGDEMQQQQQPAVVALNALSFRNSKSLRHLVLIGCSGFEVVEFDCPQIQSIHIEYCRLASKGFASIFSTSTGGNNDDYFDDVAIRQRYLNLESLTLIESFTVDSTPLRIQGMPRLKHIRIDSCFSSTTSTSSSAFPAGSIDNIGISTNPFTISGLEGCPQIESITLEQVAVEDFGFVYDLFANSRHLKRVDFTSVSSLATRTATATTIGSTLAMLPTTTTSSVLSNNNNNNNAIILRSESLEVLKWKDCNDLLPVITNNNADNNAATTTTAAAAATPAAAMVLPITFDCPKLRQFKYVDKNKLPTLLQAITLTLSRCTHLEKFKVISTALRELDLTDCASDNHNHNHSNSNPNSQQQQQPSMMPSFESLEYCTALRRVVINNCPALVDGDLEHLVNRNKPHLVSLHARDCPNLRDPCFRNPALVFLDLSRCANLQQPQFISCRALRRVNMAGCPNLNGDVVRNLRDELLSRLNNSSKASINISVDDNIWYT